LIHLPLFVRICLLTGLFIGHLTNSLAERPVYGLSTPPATPPYIVQLRHFSTEQGLPNRSVTEIAQDAQGFIWIGTLNSAYRFDGSRFLPLPEHPRPSRSQLPVYVSNIRTDHTGTLWFLKARSALEQWVERWVPGQQKTISYTIRLASGAGPAQFSIAQLIGERGVKTLPSFPLVFFQEDGHVYRYAGKKTLTPVYASPTPIHLNTVTTTTSGALVLVMSDTAEARYQLVELNASGRLRRRLELPKLLRPVCTDAQGRIYFAQRIDHQLQPDLLPRLTGQQIDRFLYRLDPNGQLVNVPIQFTKNPFPASRTTTNLALMNDQIIYDPHHDLFWFLGKETLFAWHPAKGVVFDLSTSNFPLSRSPTFGSLTVDRSGGVWVALDDGFLLLTLTPNRFQRYLYHPLYTNAGFGDATRGLMLFGNSLWINAKESWLVDLKTGNRRMPLSLQKIQQTNFLEQESVIAAQDSALWTARVKLALVNPVTQTITQFPLRGINNICLSIWPDGRRNLWLGYNQGISYFNVAQKQNQPFVRYNRFPELAENRVNGFFPDRQAGGLWVAASSGLYLLDTLNGIMARYSTEQPAPRHLPFNHVTFVHADPDQPGIYWLATRGGGLIRWERATGRYRQFTQANGLLNATLYCLYTDHPDPAQRHDKNRLWFTTDYGLVSFDKRTEQFRSYLPKDGTTHEEFNLLSHYQAPDGRLFLGGLNGVTAFQPNQIQANGPVNGPLVVTQVQQVDGRTGNMVSTIDSYQPGQSIQVASSSRAFLVSFALLDYRFLGQTRLWYRIGGWQDAWTSQLQSDLRINGLPPGAYQLYVRMKNNNGQWVSNMVTIPVVVEPPIYQRIWFLGLALLSSLGVFIALFRWRNRRLMEETVRLEAEVAHRTAQIEADKAIIEQQAAELRENDTLKSRFFANVTHEFRTPLTLLIGPIAYLAKRNTDTATGRLLVTMERNARQLQELVNDLLGLGKLEAGQIQLDPQPADLRSVVARTVAAFTSQASFAGVTLISVGLDRPLGMLFDVAKLETVLRNLIANALHFTPGGGNITIRLVEEQEIVRLSVEDTGSGIHPNDLPHIFDRYYQSRQPDAPLRGGTGIGLALCREYCQLWQGEITAESTLGQGSVFTFTYPKVVFLLPATSQHPLPAEAAAQKGAVPPEETTTDRERVLIVEDNPDMASYIQTLLEPHYALHWCRNGRDAYGWLVQQPVEDLPQLILTDMMMPEMDGMALLAMLRKQTSLRRIPVIMLTARVSREVQLRALQLGVADYLTKPFDEDELLARVHNLLDRAVERNFWLTQEADEEPAGEQAASTTEHWLQGIQQQIVVQLTDSRFQVNDLAEAANMSQRQFYRRIKTLTGLSPIQFVQDVRLQTARELLESNRYKTIKEVAFSVGFQKVSYFSRLFQQRYGISPSAMLNQQQADDSVV
jgi:signal transduction histidine kinase/DNA-binding response OmpR family regulator/ligand-binding sensor domain-containing protein